MHVFIVTAIDTDSPMEGGPVFAASTNEACQEWLREALAHDGIEAEVTEDGAHVVNEEEGSEIAWSIDRLHVNQ
jgi:hypothetical protein